MPWKPRDLNEAICYAKGWNDAIEAAAKIAEENIKDDKQLTDIAASIRILDKSMKATSWD